MSLERSREVKAALAAGNPPKGWPRIPEDGGDAHLKFKPGDPAPKCSLILCANPAAYYVSIRSLTRFVGSSQYACEEHLEHFTVAAEKWVSV